MKTRICDICGRSIDHKGYSKWMKVFPPKRVKKYKMDWDGTIISKRIDICDKCWDLLWDEIWLRRRKEKND